MLVFVLLAITITVSSSTSSSSKEFGASARRWTGPRRVSESTENHLHPWIFECAKDGLVDMHLPSPGSDLEALLSCMVDRSLTDRFAEEELSLRDGSLEWCLPPSFLDRSCLSADFDPQQYLVGCLFDGPSLGSFYFENETGTTDPFADDQVVVEKALINGLCGLINGLRSPQGVKCLVGVCQAVSDSPSAVPSVMPSLHPTKLPSVAPSVQVSEVPTTGSTNNTSLESLPAVLRDDDLLLRYPPLLVRVEILLKFVLEGVTRPASWAASDDFHDILATSVVNVFEATVDGHVSMAILSVDVVQDSDDVSVLLLAAAVRECVDCSASNLSEEIVAEYLRALKSSSNSGSLEQSI